MAGYTLFYISGAIIQNASVSAPVLSLQDAFGLQDFEFDQIGVFPKACSVAASQNCTASCLDASMMFANLEIFHNCLLYPAVAELYVNGSLSDSPLTDSLGIHKQSQAMQTANNISTTIYNCLSSYCREDKHCTYDLQQHSSFSYYIEYEEQPNATIFEFEICDYVAPFSFLNADIGGIGVSTNSVQV